jgi:hypothetical protein
MSLTKKKLVSHSPWKLPARFIAAKYRPGLASSGMFWIGR